MIWGPSGELVDRSDPDSASRAAGNTAEGRREKSLQAAGGATVLVGRDIADLRRAEWGLFLNVALAGTRDARRRDFRRMVRRRARAGADQANQPDGARDVGRRSERAHRGRADRQRARAGGLDAERCVRSAAPCGRAGAAVHRRCVARASHADLGAARRDRVGARSRAHASAIQRRADGRPARGASHAGHRRAAARARARRGRARCAGAGAGRDATRSSTMW